MSALHASTKFLHLADFTTEQGAVLPSPRIAYRSWGSMNEDRSNVVVIFHALSGSADADDWFGPLFGPNAMADPSTDFILCANVVGSCYGSSNASDPHPEDGQAWGLRFPAISIRDMVRLQQQLLDHLKVREVKLAVGGSMGAMQAMEFCLLDHRVQRAVFMAAGLKHSAWAISWNHLQRQAIQNDPAWKNGQYDPRFAPSEGLSLARQIAMLSYRSFSDYEEKFGRRTQESLIPPSTLAPYFQAESYLNYQGRKMVSRFDARAYYYLTLALDSHDVLRGRSFSAKEVLSRISIPVLVLGIDSDVLYPIEEQKEIAELLPQGRFGGISSKHGHDAFLIEFDQVLQHYDAFMHSFPKVAVRC
jgi:homoserine O-acetyltransferase